MMFRDMIKSVSAVCCAVVMVCANGAWGMSEDVKCMSQLAQDTSASSPKAKLYGPQDGWTRISCGRVNVIFSGCLYGVGCQAEQTPYVKKIHESIANVARQNSVRVDDCYADFDVPCLAEISHSPFANLLAIAIMQVRLKETLPGWLEEKLPDINEFLSTNYSLKEYNHGNVSSVIIDQIKVKIDSLPKGILYVTKEGEIFCSKYHLLWSKDVLSSVMQVIQSTAENIREYLPQT
jgi:hypothetical protein